LLFIFTINDISYILFAVKSIQNAAQDVKSVGEITHTGKAHNELLRNTKQRYNNLNMKF